ncbi:MAG TPA: hypothetical protein PLU72_05720 [Candidatus Ozemobacteraceae bacterium]|nr:hypothetical protein [Candidatus Ozemobacteraceae bacterium]HQG30264.1 hypothetical protein [Candidatus Ozemobacteraceae bacterium]
MRASMMCVLLLTVFLGIAAATSAFPLDQDFFGVSKSNKTGKFWPFILRITSLDESTGEISGQITWKSLDAVHTLTGTLQGDVLEFTETAAVKQGKGRLNVAYRLQKSGTRWEGDWTGPDGDLGAASMEEVAADQPQRAVSLPVRKDLSGEAASEKTGKTWPFVLRIIELKEATGEFTGQITWKTLGAQVKIQGTLKGATLEFTELPVGKKARAGLNGSFAATISLGRAEGSWKNAGGTDNGTVVLSWKY